MSSLREHLERWSTMLMFGAGLGGEGAIVIVIYLAVVVA